MFDFLTKRLNKKPLLPYSSRYFPSGGIIPPEYTTRDYLRSYSDVGWWHAVVFRIALGMSEVQWNLSDVVDRNKPKQVFDHPVLNLLHLCNPYQTSEELIALDTIYMESLGESFWVLNYNGKGEPAEIVLAYPDLMSVIPAQEFPFIKGYVYGIGENAVPLDTKEVIHFKYPNPLNQFRGLGQAAAIGVNLSAERNADKWVDQFFYNSARPDGVIQFDYSLSDEQFDKLKKQWGEKYRGVNKAHQVALLEGGGKYIQIQNSVKDMDFPNLKQKNRDIILGIEGMPLSVMGISENVNKANAEAGDYTFARWVLKPRLDWKKAKLQEQLLPKFKNSQNLKLGFDEIVPETAEQKRLDAESGMRAGYLTVNEARIATGKDPLPSNVGDVLLLPLNLIPTSIHETIQPPPAPAPVGEAPEETPEESEEETHEDEQDAPKGFKGGEGSGNFDHEGRPGEVGGSGDGGGGGTSGGDNPSDVDGGGNENGEGGNSGSDWQNSLSDKEKGHIRAWREGDEYKNIRDAERGIGRPEDIARAEEFNVALDKDGSYKGITYRGAKLDDGRFQELGGIVDEDSEDYGKITAKEITLKASASASPRESVASGFTYRGKGDHRVLFRIDGKTGVDLSSIDSLYDFEKEVILRKGTTYTVTSSSYENRLTTIDLKEK